MSGFEPTHNGRRVVIKIRRRGLIFCFAFGSTVLPDSTYTWLRSGVRNTFIKNIINSENLWLTRNAVRVFPEDLSVCERKYSEMIV